MVFVYNNSDIFTNKIKETTDKISLSDFNPITSSKLINSSKVISPEGINSKFDARQFTGFLPQPWGFLAFWVILIVIFLFLLQKFVFRGEFPRWLAGILIGIGIILIFQYKIPYDTVDVSGIGKCDQNNKFIVENNYLGIGSLGVSISCSEYRSSQCRTTCIKQKPMCQCEANLIDIIFHQKGDWFFGG